MGRSAMGTRLCLVVLAAATLVCCSTPESEPDAGDPGGCLQDSECEGELVCVLGECRTECLADDDCSGARACIRAADSDRRVCTIDEEEDCSEGSCPDDLACGPDGFCREPCDEQMPCGTDRECIDGVCLEVEG
jgi:hypothetical protein